MKIEQTLTPESKDIDFLTKKINEETIDKGTAYPFVFFIRDDSDQHPLLQLKTTYFPLVCKPMKLRKLTNDLSLPSQCLATQL